MSKIGVFTHVRTLEPVMIADLDTLLIALYVELTDRIIPSLGFTRSGPGQRPEVTDAELVCLAVAQVLLRFDDERHWLRAARSRVGHLFPRLLGQSEYNQRLKNAGPLLVSETPPGVGTLTAGETPVRSGDGHPSIYRICLLEKSGRFERR